MVELPEEGRRLQPQPFAVGRVEQIVRALIGGKKRDTQQIRLRLVSVIVDIAGLAQRAQPAAPAIAHLPLKTGKNVEGASIVRVFVRALQGQAGQQVLTRPQELRLAQPQPKALLDQTALCLGQQPLVGAKQIAVLEGRPHRRPQIGVVAQAPDDPAARPLFQRHGDR